jgi:phosphoglucosamine mutase
VRDAEATFGAGGRVLVRASGTEPIVRVMVEAEDQGDARSRAEAIARVVADSLGAA